MRLGLVAVIAALCGAMFNGVGSAAPIGNDAFFRIWVQTDRAVAEGRANRTWMWGPEAGVDPLLEQYAESPGGWRLVQYFDKSRMEITHPDDDPGSAWYVTNGLLAEELITGRMQVGDSAFEQYAPAQVNVSGDLDDPDGPTYATFNSLMINAPIPSGWTITQTVTRSGQVGGDIGLSSFDVTAVDVQSPTNHTVASVFWDFMTHTGYDNPFYVTGYPLTEAYWVTVKVAGTPTRVLTQVFERRVLTYTPSNPDGWKVEAGNVGQHYYQWRYWFVYGGIGFCSTTAPPSSVDRWWANPVAGMTEAYLELWGRTPQLGDRDLDNATMIRNYYNLATAYPGCMSSVTDSYLPWLKSYLSYWYSPPSQQGEQAHHVACLIAKAQVDIALQQPASPLGQKIRQIAQGLDPLRPATGTDAYWTYLVGPALRGPHCYPGYEDSVAAAFQNQVIQYHRALASDPIHAPDFGTFLARQGFTFPSDGYATPGL